MVDVPDMSSFVDVLIEQLGEQAVVTDRDALCAFGSDGFPIAGGLPDAVCFPTTTEQVAMAVRIAGEAGLPIVARGSGTGLAGGCVAYGSGLIICTSRMTRIESVDLPNRVAVVQAGVLNAELTRYVQAQPGGARYRFAPDPSSQTASTIGGNAATNAGGIGTLKHGVTSQHILAMEFVTGQGRIEVTGNAGHYDRLGPDVTGLMVGNEGTLGIITRVWCRLSPVPEHFRTAYAVFPSTADCCNAVSDIIAAGIIPVSMEVMDGQMIRVVEQAFAYGFPTEAQSLLLVEIDGLDFELDRELDRIVSLCRGNKAFEISQCADAQRRAELWQVRKRAFGAIGRVSPGYCTQDACVPRSKLADVIEHIGRLGAKYDMPISNVFHAGDGNVHPIMMFDADDPKQVQTTMHLSHEILEYCISVGGTITGEHGVGVEKLAMMGRMFDQPTIGLMQRIKHAMDPNHHLNEGKLIPSDRVEIKLTNPGAMGNPGGALAT